MSLSKRIREAQGGKEPAGSERRSARSSRGDARPTSRAGRAQFLDELRHKIQHHLIQELGPLLYDGRLSEDALRRQVHEQLALALSQETAPLSAAEREQLFTDLSDNVLGYGPIDRLLKDPTVNEVMVNGPSMVYVERQGKLLREAVAFQDELHLRRIIDKIVAQVGRRIDEATPMVDARLPDGSRVNAVIRPLAIGGPFLTVRRFSADPFSVDDLIDFGTLSAPVAQLLEHAVEGRLNVIVSGGTGTGKTTLLNVLSGFIPSDERIITIEDAKELQLRQEHVLNLESRPANIEGRGEVKIRDLVRNALRMRPDRIVVGEVRGGEALDMLQAMNTGHDGSLTTVHANAPRDALSRIETMTLMAGLDLPTRAIREQMASAIDLIVQLARLRDGSRRVTHVTEVQAMEGDVILLQDLYLFDYGMGVDDRGRFSGCLKSTGVPPKFAEKLRDHGVKVDPKLFAPDKFASRAAPARRA